MEEISITVTVKGDCREEVECVIDDICELCSHVDDMDVSHNYHPEHYDFS